MSDVTEKCGCGCAKSGCDCGCRETGICTCIESGGSCDCSCKKSEPKKPAVADNKE